MKARPHRRCATGQLASSGTQTGAPRSLVLTCLAVGAALWLIVVPTVSAQDSCTTDCPDPDFNRLDTSGSIQLSDCFEASDQSNAAEPGNGCQSYAANFFESLDPNVDGFCDSNILHIWLWADTDFFYVEFEGTDSWNCDDVGSAHQYNVEFDVDRLTESPGPRGDFLFQYQGKPEHLCPDNGIACSLEGSWIVADEGGDGTVTGFSDEPAQDSDPNDVGGPNPTTSDFDCGDCTGYSGDFKTDNDVFARILTRGSKRVIQFAVRADVLPGEPIAIVFTTVQSSTFSSSDFLFHDLISSSDLPTHNFDNCCEEGETPAVVSSLRAFAGRRGPIVEWETAGEIGPVDFRLYRLDRESGEWFEVSDGVVPAVRQAPGGIYRVRDDRPAAGAPLVYKIAELEKGLLRREHGPYRVELEWQRDRGREWDGNASYEAHLRLPSARHLERLAASRRELSGPAGRAAAGAGSPGLRPSPGQPAIGPTPLFPDTHLLTRQRAKVGVVDSGPHVLTAGEIAASMGASPSATMMAIRTGQLEMTYRGEPVAYHALGNGSHLLFYGEAPESPYSKESLYLLGAGRGLLMDGADGAGPAAVERQLRFRDTLHVERDLLPRTYLASGPEDDYWFQDVVVSGDPTYGTSISTFEVRGLASGSRSEVLGATLRGLAGPKSVEVSVNGTVVGSSEWSGTADHSAQFTLPLGVLVEGSNRIELTGLAGDFMVDSFDLEYSRTYVADDDRLAFRGDRNRVVTVSGFSTPDIMVFDLSDPKRPLLRRDVTIESDPAGGYRLSMRPGHRSTPYLAVASSALEAGASVRGDAPSELRSRSNSAEYLVVTSGNLWDSAEELALYRQGQGMDSMVVDIEDVMDEFSGGMFDPGALGEFLAYAHREWAGPPRMVVLVGAGHFDYRDHLGLGANHLPPLMVKTVGDLAPSDGKLVDFDGDGRPDLPIGRIPALLAADVEDYLAKLRAYETALSDAWKERVTLVADDRDPLVGDFPSDSDRLANRLPAELTPEKIYLAAPYELSKARQLLLTSWNDGARLVNFVGHGGFDRFAGEGLLTTADVTTLTNGERLPVVTSLTCLIGYFGFPGFTSLGEELILHPGGGAIAVLGPTHVAYNSDSTTLGEHLFDAIFSPDFETLGESLMAGYDGFVSSEWMNSDPAVLRTFVLLGDPALRMP